MRRVLVLLELGRLHVAPAEQQLQQLLRARVRRRAAAVGTRLQPLQHELEQRAQLQARRAVAAECGEQLEQLVADVGGRRWRRGAEPLERRRYEVQLLRAHVQVVHGAAGELAQPPQRVDLLRRRQRREEVHELVERLPAADAVRAAARVRQ